MVHGKGGEICTSRWRNCLGKRTKRWPNGTNKEELGASFFPRPSRVAGLSERRVCVERERELLGVWTGWKSGEREKELRGRVELCGSWGKELFGSWRESRWWQGSEPRATRASGPTSEPTARAGARHELGSSRAEGRRESGKSQLPFSFLSFGFCVNDCGKAPVGSK